MKSKEKKKKKHGGIFLVLFIILVLFLYKACGGTRFNKTEETVIASCENFLKAYQTGESEELTKWMADAAYGSDVRLDGYPEIIGGTMTYKIKEITEENEEKYYVQACIKAMDLISLMEQEEAEEQVTEENLLDSLEKMIDTGEIPMKEYDVQIQMVEENGVWKVKMDNLLSDALLGGYVTYYQELLEEIVGEL